ncbi:MAG TPA: alkaline phosphatase family protein [Blastocatellia bacterium]|nr:alkaline phosphatase family protein [Blastocatellia bacterium]
MKIESAKRLSRQRDQSSLLPNRFISRYLRSLAVLILASVWLGQPFAVCAQGTEGEKRRKQESKVPLEKISSNIILLTISGLKAEDLNHPEIHGYRIPAIQALKGNGASAVSVESIYPSLTFPAHISIATGTLPADHGIRADHPFDERLGTASALPYLSAKEIKTDTIWDAAKRGGFLTAAVGYPLTYSANIDFNLPAGVDEQEASKNPLTVADLSPREQTTPRDLLDKLSAQIKDQDLAVNKGPKEIARSQQRDRLRAVAAAYLIENHRPNLLMLNFGSYAVAAQKFGVLSKEAATTLEFIDDQIKKIVQSIEQAQLTNETTIFIASDYGLMKVERAFKPNVLLAKNGWLETGGNGRIIAWRAVAQTFGGSAAIFVKNHQDEKTIEEVEKLFTKCHEKPDSPIWRIISRREISQLGADPQVAFYIDAAPSYGIISRAIGPITARSTDEAANGYLPSRSEVRAALVISGKGIKPGSSIEYARLIDIAPTMARLLGLEMRTARGRVLSEVIDK